MKAPQTDINKTGRPQYIPSQPNIIIMYARKGTFNGRGMVGRGIKTAKTAIFYPSKPKKDIFLVRKWKKLLKNLVGIEKKINFASDM